MTERVKNFVNGWTLKDILTVIGVAWLLFQRWNDVGALKVTSEAQGATIQTHTQMLSSIVTVDEVQKVQIEDLKRRIAVLEGGRNEPTTGRP